MSPCAGRAGKVVLVVQVPQVQVVERTIVIADR